MEADKWLPIVKANREAPTLRFTADKAGAAGAPGLPASLLSTCVAWAYGLPNGLK